MKNNMATATETYAQARRRLLGEFHRLGFRTSSTHYWAEPMGREFRLWLKSTDILVNEHPLSLDYRELSAREILDHVQRMLLR